MDEDELLSVLSDRYDPDEIVDILGLTSHELLHLLRESVLLNLHLFVWEGFEYKEQGDGLDER